MVNQMRTFIFPFGEGDLLGPVANPVLSIALKTLVPVSLGEECCGN